MDKTREELIKLFCDTPDTKWRENYCDDCTRSIKGSFPSCDVNAENHGIFVNASDHCETKMTKGE